MSEGCIARPLDMAPVTEGGREEGRGPLGAVVIRERVKKGGSGRMGDSISLYEKLTVSTIKLYWTTLLV